MNFMEAHVLTGPKKGSSGDSFDSLIVFMITALLTTLLLAGGGCYVISHYEEKSKHDPKQSCVVYNLGKKYTTEGRVWYQGGSKYGGGHMAKFYDSESGDLITISQPFTVIELKK